METATATVDNPWFPPTAGTVPSYNGEDEGTSARDVFIVTKRRKVIQGIRATVVFEHGRRSSMSGDE